MASSGTLVGLEQSRFHFPDSLGQASSGTLATGRSAYVDAVGAEVGFQFRDIDHVEMEHGGCQENRRAGLDGLVKMLQFAGTAGGDDLGRRGLLHRTDDGQIGQVVPDVAGLVRRQSQLRQDLLERS